MTVWSRVSEFVSSAPAAALSAVIETVRTVLEGDPATRRQVSFSIAIIALSAKMAKADGVVSKAEVDAFRDIFEIPAADAAHVVRLYNLAKKDVAGFGAYARRIRDLFPGDEAILVDVMDALFHIAKSDGMVHEKEMDFMDRIAQVFGVEGNAYERVRLRHMHPEDGNPYELIGALPQWSNEELKSFYRKLVQENHPDRLIARGVPEEFIAIANARLAVDQHGMGFHTHGAGAVNTGGPVDTLVACQWRGAINHDERVRQDRIAGAALYRDAVGRRRPGLAVPAGEPGIMPLLRLHRRNRGAVGAGAKAGMACRRFKLAWHGRSQLALGWHRDCKSGA